MSRWLMYIGMAGAIGGAFCQIFLSPWPALRQSLQRYTLLMALLGSLGLGLYFLCRVGALAEQGVAGLFDPLMRQILWQSSVGDAVSLRGIGFATLFLALMLGRGQLQGLIARFAETALAVTGALLIAVSFSRTGHVGEQGFWAAGLLSIHVILAAWWMGSLYPLWLAGHRLTGAQAHRVMEWFGKLAVVAVVCLLVAGIGLSYMLTGWTSLLTTGYGGWLMLKLVLVLLILLLAAYHKFVLVPVLAETGDSDRLKRSIMLEKLLGVSIFAVTTVLTTLVGPGH